MSKELSLILTYVTQQYGSLISTLIVRDTLYYQAKLRISIQEHHKIPVIINILIKDVNLTDSADTLIGSNHAS